MRPKYPPFTPGVRRLTQSEIDSYLGCPVQWWIRKQDHRNFTTGAMVLGTAVGESLRVDCMAKMKYGNGLHVDDLIEVATCAFDRECETSEIRNTTDGELVNLRDSALPGAVECYARKLSPLIVDPIATEEPIVARIAPDLEIAGTLDYVVSEGVPDLKTGSSFNQDKADGSVQLTMYAYLHRVRYGRDPDKVWLDKISFTKTRGWEHARLSSTRSERDYRGLLWRVRQVDLAMRSNVLTPARDPAQAWWCGPKCFTYERCPAMGLGSLQSVARTVG